MIENQEYDPAGTQRPEDVPLWSYFGRGIPDYNRTKMGRIWFFTYFGFAMSGMHLASGNVERFPSTPILWKIFKS